jgi:cell division protein FtsN
MTRRPQPRKRQFGGFLIGLIVGLLIGLALALAVAMYIAKVPVPFMDKVGHRSAEQDASEVEKLKTWDPNAGLVGKQVPRPVMGASAPEGAASGEGAPPPRPLLAPVGTRTAPPTPTAASASATSAGATPSPSKWPTLPVQAVERAASESSPATASRPTRDPAAILAGEPVSGRIAEARPKLPTPAPLAPTITAPSSALSPAVSEGFLYFVQAGAYANPADAEQQRARLAIQGLVAKISEREQAGRTIYRVRLGPMESREAAEKQQDRLKASGAEATVIRVEKPKT